MDLCLNLSLLQMQTCIRVIDPSTYRTFLSGCSWVTQFSLCPKVNYCFSLKTFFRKYNLPGPAFPKLFREI